MTEQKAKQAAPAKKVEVTLKAPVEQRGVLRPAGSKIEVTPRQAEWLRERGAA